MRRKGWMTGLAVVAVFAVAAGPALAGMAMFRQFRLSVSPVTPEEWAEIMKMAA